METYKYYLKDLVTLLKEKLEQAYNDLSEKPLKNEEGFLLGQKFALYDVLDLIKSQANAFGIPLNEIGLDNYILEKYL